MLSAIERKDSTLAVQNYLSEFKERVERLEAAQEKVEMEISASELEQDIEAADHYYSKQVRRVINCVDEYLASKVTDRPGLGSDADSVASTTKAVEAKLPKIELPEYSGDVAEWPSFWEQFEAIVDSTDLPVVTKFTYLRTLLKGEAKSAISGLKLTAANYQTAVALLKDRFGRTDRIIFSHIEALLQLKVAADPSVSQLWTMFNKLQSHIRSLEAMGITGSQYGVILTPLVLSRLPASLRLEWVRESEKA